MKYLLFLSRFFKNPRSIGAFLPSSRYLAEKMISEVAFEHANLIIEYGPGTGAFTNVILKNRNQNTQVMLIESDQYFYSLLKRKYRNIENLVIINGSAENIDQFVKSSGSQRIDYIISGLPFTSLPKKVSDEILGKTKRMLGEKGRFITFQYSIYKQAYFKEFFKKVDVKREYRNVPPAFILSCSN